MKLVIFILNKLFSFVKWLLRNNTNKSHIVILAFKFIGDTVFTIPAIQKIINLNPDRKIIICCHSFNVDIYKIYFNSIDYMIFNKVDLQLDKRSITGKFIKAALQIRALRPGSTFDLMSGWKSALMNAMIGSREQVGFGNPLLKGFYDFFIPEEVNQIDLYLKPVSLFYNNISDMDYQLNIPRNKISNISICIIPFAGWKAKEWNLKKYIELAELLSKDYDTKILYENDKMDKEIEKFLSQSNITLVTTHSIDEMIKIISQDTLVISNDTGPLHLSYLLGKYTIGIFGPTNPDYLLFDTKRQYYIRKKLPCSPKTGEKLCFTFGGRIGCPSNECMNLLSVEEVFKDINEYIFKIKQANL